MTRRHPRWRRAGLPFDRTHQNRAGDPDPTNAGPSPKAMTGDRERTRNCSLPTAPRHALATSSLGPHRAFRSLLNPGRRHHPGDTCNETRVPHRLRVRTAGRGSHNRCRPRVSLPDLVARPTVPPRPRPQRSELTMTWTVACFCGNLYAAPPNRCDACGRTVEAPPSRGPATRWTENAADLREPAATVPKTGRGPTRLAAHHLIAQGTRSPGGGTAQRARGNTFAENSTGPGDTKAPGIDAAAATQARL
jgi:hypothetical protein